MNKMHGEYKTPGGKMVVVDFSVVEGALCGVQVSGDFFLYPDDALPQIANALEGSAATSEVNALADCIKCALSPEVVLLGFSPEAVGRAVRNALGDSQ